MINAGRRRRIMANNSPSRLLRVGSLHPPGSSDSSFILFDQLVVLYCFNSIGFIQISEDTTIVK